MFRFSFWGVSVKRRFKSWQGWERRVVESVSRTAKPFTSFNNCFKTFNLFYLCTKILLSNISGLQIFAFLRFVFCELSKLTNFPPKNMNTFKSLSMGQSILAKNWKGKNLQFPSDSLQLRVVNKILWVFFLNFNTTSLMVGWQ
jgi:hypothetical protein